MQTIVALLLVAVAAVSASTFSEMVIRQKRTSGGSPLTGALGSVPVVGGVVNTAAGAVGGLVGASVAADGKNDQAAECAKTNCAPTSCTAQSNTNNNANGDGGLLGVGQLIGPVNVNIPICPSICLQCNQLGLLTLG